MKTVAVIAFAAVTALIPVAAPAEGGFHVAFSGSGYALAATCDLTQPIAFITLAMSNTEPAPVPAFTIAASETYGVLGGTVTIPALAGGDTRTARVPLRYTYVARSPQQAAGLHYITVTAGDRALPQLSVIIPSSFCPPGPPPTVSATGTATSHARAHRVAADGHPVLIDQNVSERSKTIAAALKVDAPRNLRAVVGAPDCATHVGVLGSLVCPDMIKSGNLLLGWDWRAVNGPDAIDGYRVYRVDGGLHQLVYTQANKQDVTLVDVAKPAGGYGGRCYAVTAYVATRESAASDAFCADGSVIAKTVMLQPTHLRGVQRLVSDNGNVVTGEYGEAGLQGLVVGYFYQETKHTLGDSFHNSISRAAVSFDTGVLLVHRFVSARLKVHVATSAGEGSNHSCATAVGSGTGTWWQNKDWIDVQSAGSVAPTDAGPQITADVTPIVAAWLRGEKNLGLVLWNEDENLKAFTNKRCETAYDSPVLEITYY